MLDQLGDPGTLWDMWKVELHVGRVFLEFVQQLLRRGPHDVMNPYHLVEFIVAGEEREKGENFEENATDTPEIHFVSIVTVS